MRSRAFRGIKSRLRGLAKPGNQQRLATPVSARDDETASTDLGRIVDPVAKFYERFAKNNLRVFNSFALQSRSLLIRDVYARAATNSRHNATSLLIEVDEYLKLDARLFETTKPGSYDRHILLALGSFLLDTARNDLDTQSGLQIFKLALLMYGEEALTDHQKLQYVEALAELENYTEQSELVRRFSIASIAPMQVDLMNLDRIAKMARTSTEWLDAINALYGSLGMSKISLDADDSLPLLDRLVAGARVKVDGPRVTVIMPTNSPGPGIHTALRSLLQQTWSNLEILVVDDGSTEEYDEVFSELEDLSTSIRVIRQQANLGSYAARNVGLAEATGAFVTTHDDDDWSHPEKIATQATALMNDEAIAATTSAHIRTTEKMNFRRVNSQPRHLQTNYSSLMFRKRVTDQIGQWDPSNRGSDTELAGRITQNFGKDSLLHFVDKPLSFSRVWDGSLTSGEMYRGYFAYSRLLYRWSFRQWHRSMKRSGTKPVLDSTDPRPFAVPTTFEPGDRHKDLGFFDVVYVTDFTQKARFVGRAMQELDTAVEFGLRVGYMHVDSPQTLKRADIPPKLFDLQLNGKVTQVADNNRAEIQLMVVYDASIGMFLDEFRSFLTVHRGVVVDDKGIFLKDAVRRDATYPKFVLQNLDQSFNTPFQIVGAGDEEQGELRDQLPPRRVLPEDFVWHTHIVAEPMRIRPPGEEAVVGFHSFGNKYRWPSTKLEFETAYFSRNHKTLFYGLLKPMTKEFGENAIPEVERLDVQSYSLEQFFASIDFWVYFPHERLQDRPWQPALLAMQAGKVVIMPRHLEPIYGRGAVYASAEDVAGLVASYTHDSDSYVEQAERGQELVSRGFDRTSYVARLNQLANSSRDL